MIEIKNISKKYQNKYVLDDISLNIQQGEVLSLLGINGAGKSTLSSIIAGIKQPTSGGVFYKNKPIYDDIFSYKKCVGFCQQTPNLDSFMTLRRNLFFSGLFFGLSSLETEERISYLSKLLDLEKYLDYYDYRLSGGFRQRFMIARSLMHNPQCLILDEPTVAMDPNIRRNLWEVIKELKKSGISILLTTHYLEEAEILSDRVCILHQGKIKIQDSVINLLARFSKNNLEDVFISFLDDYEKELYGKELL